VASRWWFAESNRSRSSAINRSPLLFMTISALVPKRVCCDTMHRILLVLTDVKLPDGNGMAIADRARDRGIEVVVITGFALQIPAEQLQRHHYLMKPVRAAELLGAIAEHLTKH
jgi:CheY-like chemotaxis protein